MSDGRQIRFTVDEPKCGRVDLQRRSKAYRRFQATAEQSLVGWRLAIGQHPDRNLRSIAVQGRTEKLAAAISNDDNVSRFRRSVNDVGTINPRMAAPQAVFSSR